MKALCIASVMMMGASAFGAPTVAVESISIDSTNRIATVRYSLSEAPCVVTLDLETNAVAGAWVPVAGGRVYGDAARVVKESGVKTAYVKFAEGNGLEAGGKVRAVVTAWELTAPPPYMVMDLEFSHLLSFYSRRESVPGGVTHDVYKTSKLLMRKIPARGITWRLGAPEDEYGRNSAETAHQVKLTSDYYIGVYEVTRAQWAYCGFGDPSDFKTGPRALMFPLQKADYRNVRGSDKFYVRTGDEVGSGTFLDWCRYRTGVKVDLPSEAQWEFACRAGSGAPHYGGYYGLDDSERSIAEIAKIGWFYNNSDEGYDAMQVHEVGLKQPNCWGLYDMIGNVREMCLDLYSETYYKQSGVQTDPFGPEQSEYYPNDYVVNRGGGYETGWWRQRASSRECDHQWAQNNVYGFRICAPAVIPTE